MGDYATITFTGSQPTTRYLHKDRLNSIIAITDSSGSEVGGPGRLFDAFGKPRNGDMSSSAGLLNGTTETTRGFTQHEHLNSLQLIHMNGRAYDYNLGRFLSVDPIIQFPENSQSLNPYSYLMNNPMAGTDPSGFVSCSSSDSTSGDCGRPPFDRRSIDPLGTHVLGTIAGRTGFDLSNGVAQTPTVKAAQQNAANLNSPSQRASMPGRVNANETPDATSTMENIVITASAQVIRGGTLTESLAVRELLKSLGRGAAGAVAGVTYGRAAIFAIAIMYPDNFFDGAHPGDYCPDGCYGPAAYPGADFAGIRGASDSTVMHNEVPELSWDDPSKPPRSADGTVWEWHGPDSPGGNKGAWVNPKNPSESYHPDLDHAPPIGPHYDHNNRSGKGSRIFPDGRTEPKK